MNDMTTNTESTQFAELLLSTAQLAAITVLESGGETSRAEEIATIICKSGGMEAEAIAFPTGIFITLEGGDGHKTTSVVRVKTRVVNLFKVERANALSRNFSSGNLSLTEFNSSLKKLRESVIYSKPFILLSMGISAAMFTAVYEQALNWTLLFDMAVAFIASISAKAISSSKRMAGSYQFTLTFMSSVIITAIAVFMRSIVGIGDLNSILIGSIMPLLPGLSLTNAIRDTVMGDIVSGTVRIVETLFIAIGIAGGVGIVLASYISFFGGAV